MKSFITYLTEKKDHIIKRLKNLTDDEKDQVIAFFSKKPNLENQIDWNNRELTFKDFEQVMDTTKTERKRQVKKHGIAGLKEGKDFLELKLPEDSPFSAYAPLHHEASRLIASKKIGGVATKWCIAANDDGEWKHFIYTYNRIPVMFVDYTAKEKYTLMLGGKDLSFNSFWDQKDNNLEERGCKDHLGIDWKEAIIKPNVALLKKARTILDTDIDLHWFEMGVKEGKIKVLNSKYKLINVGVSYSRGRLVWENGIWRDGTWKGGDWIKGIWKDGKWRGGIWRDGTWEKGTWEDGTWKGGTWKDGTFHDGIWEDGTWKDGTWGGEEWIKGTWKDGKWWNGTWRNGTWEGGIWEDGGWVRGFWKGGTWEDGIWNGGTWEKGTWKDGTWKGGTWKNGTWEGGTWKDGTWEDGTWWRGVWKGGTWVDGTWKDGTWEGGTWKGGYWDGGYDKNGKYHEKGDSPDKW